MPGAQNVVITLATPASMNLPNHYYDDFTWSSQ